MRIEVTVCDRCGVRADEHALVRIARGDERRTRELCTACLDELTRWLGSSRTQVTAKANGNGDDARHALVVANRGLEAWADGASADDLAGVLRDVVSAANRDAREHSVLA